MKQSTVLAGLAAGFAAAAHHDHAHAHAHNQARRGDDGVVTSWDITTKWTYVTVTGPAGPADTEASAAAQAPPSSSAAANDVSAAAVTAAPSSSSMDANAIQMSINSAQKASDLAHQSSMEWLQAHPSGGSAPAQSQATSAAAVASSSAVVAPSKASSSSAAAPAQSSGGSTASSGAGMTGIGTYYAGSGAYGSCGSALSDNDHGVALAENIMTSSNKKFCGAAITIVSGGKSWPATVVDSCGACTTDPDGHIDILQGYAHVIDPSIDTAGHADLTWSFNDASMASAWKSATG